MRSAVLLIGIVVMDRHLERILAYGDAVRTGFRLSATVNKLAEWLSATVNKLAEWLSATVKIVLSVLTLVGIGFLGYAMYSEYRPTRIVVEPILVPRRIADTGYTDQALARQIRDALDHMLTVVKTSTLQYATAGATHDLESTVAKFTNYTSEYAAALDVTLPATGLSLRWILEYLTPPQRLGGAVVELTPDTFRFSGHVSASTTPLVFTAHSIDDIITRAAEGYLAAVSPSLLSIYYLQSTDALINIDAREAIRRLTDAVRLLKDPTLAAPLQTFYTALAYTNRGQARSIVDDSPERAIEDFQNALKASPMTYTYVIWARELNRHGRPTEEVDALFNKASTEPYAFAYNAYGDFKFSAGQYLAATQWFSKVLAISTATSYEKAHAYVMLGRLRAKDNNNDAAISAFNRAIKEVPEDDYAYCAWGDLLFDQRKYSDAAGKFDIAEQKNPNYDYAGVRKGEALAKLRDKQAAIDEFNQVVEKKPNYDYTYKAWGRWLLTWKDPAAAAEKLQKGQTLNPGDAEYCVLLDQAGTPCPR